MNAVSKRKAFTLIELLAVIGIIVLVMSMALPGMSAMMRAKKWSAALSNVQAMVTRARALATGVRTDFSVEFRIRDNGTVMWLESEVNDIERIPDLMELQREMGGSAPIRYFLNTFYSSGGRYKSMLYEVRCLECGKEWSYKSGGGSYKPCPGCGREGWTFQPEVHSYYYDITYDPDLAFDGALADNARQSEIVLLAPSVTIDRTKCRNFFSWDAKDSVECYGYDEYPDIRVGVNGALMQTVEPVIALQYGIGRTNLKEWRGIRVIRCTGRVIPQSLDVNKN